MVMGHGFGIENRTDFFENENDIDRKIGIAAEKVCVFSLDLLTDYFTERRINIVFPSLKTLILHPGCLNLLFDGRYDDEKVEVKVNVTELYNVGVWVHELLHFASSAKKGVENERPPVGRKFLVGFHSTTDIEGKGQSFRDINEGITQRLANKIIDRFQERIRTFLTGVRGEYTDYIEDVRKLFLGELEKAESMDDRERQKWIDIFDKRQMELLYRVMEDRKNFSAKRRDYTPAYREIVEEIDDDEENLNIELDTETSLLSRPKSGSASGKITESWKNFVENEDFFYEDTSYKTQIELVDCLVKKVSKMENRPTDDVWDDLVRAYMANKVYFLRKFEKATYSGILRRINSALGSEDELLAVLDSVK